jgi:methionyl-tRNA formyltransferase
MEGTPAFAVLTMEVAAGLVEYEIVCVITQPDRPLPAGCWSGLPAVDEAALRLGLTGR